MTDLEPDDVGSVEQMRQGLQQLWRYGLVGIINVAIDFSITNLLVLLTGAYGTVSLFFISLTACLVATLNGYRMNRSWTFGYQSHQLSGRLRLKYFAVAMLALIVNTSVFLFVYQFLINEFGFSRIISVNLAKGLAVGTSAVVAFIGYRVSVFQPEVVQQFRRSFTFEPSSMGYSLRLQLGILFAFSFIIGAIYLSITTAVMGEAVGYAWTAQSIANGNYALIDLGWYNPFCLWQSLFYKVGLNHIQSAIGASFVPGLVLFIPVTLIARLYYGERVAWLVGAVTIVHPRLMAYSCNGMPDTFGLLLLTSGLALCSYVGWRQTSYWPCFVAGGLLGFYSCGRIEGIILLILLVIGLCIIGRRDAEFRPFIVILTLMTGCLLAVCSYALISDLLTGTFGIHIDKALYSKLYVEQFDPVSAAREVYGFDAIQLHAPHKRHLLETLRQRVVMIPSHIFLTLQSLPGVLLTPLWLFAFLLPMFTHKIAKNLLPEWPWVLLLFFSLAYSAVFSIAPSDLLPLVFPAHLFGVAGLVALACFIGRSGLLRYIYPSAAMTLVVFCLLIAYWRARDIENSYQFQRLLAQWVKSNVPSDEGIVGDGYGYVSITGFLAQHRTSARVLHYDPTKVVQFVRNANAKWLILYEPFVAKVNPELLGALDFGMPGMTMKYETRDHRNRRIQVYHLNP